MSGSGSESLMPTAGRFDANGPIFSMPSIDVAYVRLNPVTEL